MVAVANKIAGAAPDDYDDKNRGESIDAPPIPGETHAQRAMNARLFVIVGNTTKRQVSLKLPAVLGRSRQADITVAHPLISRRHCELSDSNGLLMLRDLASLNGTMIAGRRIKSAALLPDSEFTIGPLTFRVLYKYEGDPNAVPDIRYVDDADGTTLGGHGDVTSARLASELHAEFAEALPAGPASESEVAMPDIMALADAEVEEVFPAEPTDRQQDSTGAEAPWPPITPEKLPTVPLPANLLNPPATDNNNQPAGGHRRESPWAIEPPDVEGLWHAATASAGNVPVPHPESPPEVPASEKDAPPPASEAPPAADASKRPSYGEEIDPEFGSFLEGLQ
jgi:hypothetical protein